MLEDPTTMTRHRLIECKVIDSTRISAWLYTTEKVAPALIMSHGVRVYLYLRIILNNTLI